MIPYNKIGLVKSGDMSGFYVKVLPDLDGTGGYYILYSKDFSSKYSEGYDDWMLTDAEVQNYFKTISVDWSE